MTIKLLVLSRLLSNTGYLLVSGYIAFILSVFRLFFYSQQNFSLWLYLVIMCLCMLAHHYISLRIRFDAQLLELVANNINEKPTNLNQCTHELDQALLELKLIPKAKTGRSWNERIKGCQKLFKIQAGLLIIQYILFILCICLFIR